MYTGFVIYYGIKIDIADLEVYNFLDFQDDEDYSSMSLEDVKRDITSRLLDEGYDLLEAYTQSCCFADDGIVFLAVFLGEYSVQREDTIGIYETMDILSSKHINKLKRIQHAFDKNQTSIELELSRLKESYPFLRIRKNNFYTVANGCSCSS